MLGNLLIKGAGTESLDELVAALPRLIGCGTWEQRNSSNYIDERYFQSFALGFELTISIADDSEFGDYDFWLTIEPEPHCAGEERICDGVADSLARKLALSGYSVLRPLDFSRVGNGAVKYWLNTNLETNIHERVLTEEVN